MGTTRIGIAISLALVSLVLFLSAATAEGIAAAEGASIETPEPPEEIPVIKLPGIGHPQMPAFGIRVVARAGLACDGDGGSPVMGARIVVITESGASMAVTNEKGEALFSATEGPAIVQIEWPAGLIPCPNSNVAIELGNGTGEAEFFALPVP